MNKIILLLAISTHAFYPKKEHRPYWHFTASLTASYMGAVVWDGSKAEKRFFGLVVGLGIGLTKELYDASTNGIVDPQDLALNALGAISGISINF